MKLSRDIRHLFAKRPRRRRSRSYRSIERMEDRCLLATFTVTNTLDSGAGSLRQAIQDANNVAGLDEIVFNIPTPPLGAVSRYPAEKDANDTVSSNHGTLKNGATFGDGIIGQGFNLDGVDDYVDIGQLPQLQNANEITVAAWVRRSDLDNEKPGFVGKWDTTDSSNNSFLLYTGEQGFANGVFVVQGDDGSLASVGGTTPFPVNEWVHIAATWRSSDGLIAIYKNGVLEGMSTGAVGRSLNFSTAFTAKIGEWGVVRDSRYKFKGQIDETEIYNRALSASEVRSLYLLGKAFEPLPPAGLVSQYRAERNANDSGDNNPGTLVNGATFADGRVGQAFSFDGVDDAVEVPHNSNLNIQGSFSAVAWIFPESVPNNSPRILDKDSNAGHHWNMSLTQVSPANALHVVISGGSSANQIDVTTPENSIPLNEWSHVGFTYTISGGSGLLKLYINGVEAASVTGLAVTMSNTAPLVIGNDSFPSAPGDANAREFDGLIDEVGIFNRALTAEEMSAIFHAGNTSQTIVHTISPTSALPVITDPVIIDGYTQPGARPNTNSVESLVGLNTVIKIELDGSQAGNSHGLAFLKNPDPRFNFNGDNSTIRGLAIHSFGLSGIYINSSDNTIQGNFLGMDASGTVARPNAVHGVFIDGNNTPGANNNLVGGTTPAARNLISGNANDGVHISAAGQTVVNNLIQGNLIGTDITGTLARGNGNFGVEIAGGADGTMIGGPEPGARNVISGNNLSAGFAGGGVYLGATQFITVQGNYVGIDVSGTAPLGNKRRGLVLDVAHSNQVFGNVIAASIDHDGANGNGIVIGNSSAGVSRPSNNNLIQGNLIGVAADGVTALGNQRDGIHLNSGVGNLIGGTEPGQANLIAHNSRHGVFLDLFGPPIENAILGNSIFANGGLGIFLTTTRPLPRVPIAARTLPTSSISASPAKP